MQYRFSSLFIFVGLILSGGFLAGCGRDTPGPREPPPDVPSSAEEEVTDHTWMEDLFNAAYDALGRGRTNEAIAVFSDALENPDLRDQRPTTFGMMTRFLVNMGLREEARHRLDAMVVEDVATARNALYEYFGDLRRAGDYREMNDWADFLLGKPLPEELERAALGWKLQAVSNLQEGDELVRAAGAVFDRAAEKEWPSLARELSEPLLKREQVGPLAAILDDLEARNVRSPEMDRVQAEVRTRLAIAIGDWAEAEKQLERATGALPDAALAGLFRAAVSAARRENRDAFVEKASRMIIEKAPDKKRSRETAARAWLHQAREAGDPAQIADRLEFLRERGLAPDALYHLFAGYFYDTIEAPEVLDRMMDFGERLLDSIEDESSRGSIRTYLLDGSFVADRYDVALAMLEEGIPRHDAQWHALAISKVSAHKALAENRPRDAIAHFRDFMAKIAASEDQENTADPASGVVHTREMILGRNARRIGDIWAGIGETDKAKAAYEEARNYYRTAIENLDDPESESSKLASKELRSIPGM